MAKKAEDVNTEETSASEEQVVKETKETNNTAETTEQETTQETTEEQAKPETEAGEPQVDETGVPWKNRAMEWKRKTEELTDKLPNMIQDAVSQSFQQQGGKQSYTEEQLEAYAEEHPEHSLWTKQEIKKLRDGKTAEVIRAEMGKWRKGEETKAQKQQAFSYVLQNHPDAFLKDAQGKSTGAWDNNSPMVKMIGQIMSDPEIANSSRGLIAAADLAAYYLSKQKAPKTQQQTAELKAEVRNLQKKTMIEGGGKQAVQTGSAKSKALERLRETGKMRDAEDAIGEILKLRKQT